MAYKGVVIWVGDVRTISDKFRVRTFVLSDGNEKYPQEVEFQVVNDKVGLLDGVEVGHVLEVEYNLRGRRSVTNDGRTVWYNKLDVWKVDRGESTGKRLTGQDTGTMPDFPY